MKRKSAWLFIALVGFASACNDDDEKATNSITNDEAAALVAMSLSSNGLADISRTSAEFATEFSDGASGGRKATCGFTEDWDFTTASEAGSTPSFSFDFNYKFELLCDGDEPASLGVALDYTGDFASSEVETDFSGLAALDLAGLQESAGKFLMNGDYKFNGSVVDKQKNKSVNCGIEMSLDDIAINKTSYGITGGKGSYDISGSVPGKGSFRYSGEIVFLGAGKAEVSVNGVVYVADMNVGTATKK